MDLTQLSAEFDRKAVQWRAQSLTKNKDKAQALAYIDARDVMDRLDEVCGPALWQAEFTETPKGRVLCRIGILTEHGWVWKSDGAGDTDVEGEKGAISDALKRAAVHWGIGRYLYSLPVLWVPCEVNDFGKWRKWTVDPWSLVREPAKAAPKPKAETKPQAQNKDGRDPVKVADAIVARLRDIEGEAGFKVLKAPGTRSAEALTWLAMEHPTEAARVDAAWAEAQARVKHNEERADDLAGTL